jgi:Fur family ferric uptake transcriptional regulator
MNAALIGQVSYGTAGTVKLLANNSHLDYHKDMTLRDPFKTILRKSGYKATGPRLAILTAFKKAKNPLSAQELIEMLPKNIDQATVYRTMRSLAEKGIIKKIDLRHNHAHYELANAQEHHHLICIRCGRIEDVHQCGVEEIEKSIIRSSKHFAEIKQHSLEFYGLCKSCAARRETSYIKNGPHARSIVQ